MRSIAVAVAVLVALLVPDGLLPAAAPIAAQTRAAPEPAPDDDSGIGGTGRGDDDSGIGGIGIHGTITAFGSIYVNGLHVHHDEGTRVEINGRQAHAEELAIGQLVWIEATTTAGSLRARTISVFSAAIGRIDALDEERGQLQVSSQRIAVPAHAILLDGSDRPLTDLSGFSVGDLVDVSGLRHPGGHIVATRIAATAGEVREDVRLPALEELLAGSRDVSTLSIEGFLHTPDASGQLRIDGLAVDTSALSEPGELIPSRRVWLRGRRTGERSLRVDQVTLHPIPIEELPRIPEAGDRVRRPRLGASDLKQVMEPLDEADPADVREGLDTPVIRELPEARGPLESPELPIQPLSPGETRPVDQLTPPPEPAPSTDRVEQR
jgi:hypothetical protein